MGHLLEFAQRLPAHPLGGRIGFRVFRVGFFQFLQLPQKMVVFKIRHPGIIQNIIPVIRFRQKGCQLLNSLFRFHSFLLFVKMYPAPRPRSPSLPQPLRCSR